VQRSSSSSTRQFRDHNTTHKHPGFLVADDARESRALIHIAPSDCGAIDHLHAHSLGRDLVLLTVTFDPQRDQPEALAHYADNWKADPATWHFLTGPNPDVHRVTNMFGMDFFPDEGLMNHSLHTAVIDRSGKLVANIEGNQFTADQLADLVKTVLSQPDNRRPIKPVRIARSADPEVSSSGR
jgi:hypothetical protein